MPSKTSDPVKRNELEKCIITALETYSNVHRGSGHFSVVTTRLFERAREIVLEFLGMSNSKFVVIFCSPRHAGILTSQLTPGSFRMLSSQDFGLALGIRAIAVERKALPKGAPSHSGGGTTRLISRDWVMWAGAPDRFEAGTPSIINIIALAKALLLSKKYGSEISGEEIAGTFHPGEILPGDEFDNLSGKELMEKLRQTCAGRDVPVPSLSGEKPFINLDNSASTPAFAPVWKTFCQVLKYPDVDHQAIIRETRAIVAEFVGAPMDGYDIIFSSNTTEAINLAAENFRIECGPGTEAVVLNTLLEHNSNDLPWRMSPNVTMIRLNIDNEGFIDLNELESALKDYNEAGRHGNQRIRLVAVSGASNVLGICNDLAAIGSIVHRYGAGLLVDGAQLVAHRKIEMEEWGIDYLALSGHKAYAPFGSGALVVKKRLLNFKANELERIKSSGEENVAGIAALGKSFVLLQRIGMDVILEEEHKLTGKLLNGMAEIPGLTVYGVKNPGSPGFADKGGVIAFSLKNNLGNVIAGKLASQGAIGIRYGCHCSHVLVKHILNVSPGLERFQHIMLTIFPKVQLPGVARASIGIENTEKDIDELIRVLGIISGKHKDHLPEKQGLSKADFKLKMKDFIKDVEEKVYGY
jgi:selenocysteine lyase/cysteine desulfurase